MTWGNHWPDSSDFISQPPYSRSSFSPRLNGSKAPRINLTKDFITCWIIVCNSRREQLLDEFKKNAMNQFCSEQIELVKRRRNVLWALLTIFAVQYTQSTQLTIKEQVLNSRYQQNYGGQGSAIRCSVMPMAKLEVCKSTHHSYSKLFFTFLLLTWTGRVCNH